MALKLQSRDLYAYIRGEHVPGRNSPLDANEMHQAYNALDSAVTLRVHQNLTSRIAESPHAQVSYQFSRAMQGPAMSMMKVGVQINAKVRQDETERYLSIRTRAQSLLDTLADAVWGPETYIEVVKTQELVAPIGKRGLPLAPRLVTHRENVERTRPRGLNASSDKQCLAFFNTALGFPVEYEIRKTPQGTIRTPSANAKALRKWAERRTKGPGVSPRDRTIPSVKLAAPFVSLILTIREADKMLAVLRTPLDPDGRMRCSYNVAGTKTGRWSSSKNVYGRGTNLQNITPSMRRMFCADDDHYFVSTDLEQAEPRCVSGMVWAALGDERYWRACHTADLHTTVASLTWPELPWREGDREWNRRVADEPCPDHPDYTYREVSKRLSNGTNYVGSAYGIASEVGVPPHLVEDFQHRYFTAFPAIPDWHQYLREFIREHQYVDTPLGRRRWIFDRPDEEGTVRKIVAHTAQSTIAEFLNYIMYRCWDRSTFLKPDDPQHLPLNLLLQNHDAFAFQTHTRHHLPTIISSINDEFVSAKIPLDRGGERRLLTIPGEFVTGFNWAYADKGSDKSKWVFSDGNPDGLRKWNGADDRKRHQGAIARPGDWLNRPLRQAV